MDTVRIRTPEPDAASVSETWPGTEGTRAAEIGRDDHRRWPTRRWPSPGSVGRVGRKVERWMRRALNVGVAALGLLLALPLLLLVAVAIRLDSRGPVLYRQERVGRLGRGAGSADTPSATEPSTFTLYKFRSMEVDAEAETGPVWASGEDPRVTRLGRWLRRLHLDELPQLWNVLVGDMNLVGPRPERPEFVRNFLREIPGYRSRLAVRPGLTGLAQVRQLSDRTVDDVRRKLRHDIEYVIRRSLWLDTVIVLKTPVVVLRRLVRGDDGRERVGQREIRRAA